MKALASEHCRLLIITQALDVFSILQQLPPNLCQASEIQFSVSVYAALAAGNPRALLRMLAEASWRQRHLLDIQLGKVNTHQTVTG